MLAIVSQLAVVTNALLIAITSNFVSFEVYTRGNYDREYNGTGLVPDERSADRGLSGYANWSTTPFNILDLVDGDAFPTYSAQDLKSLNDDGTDVKILTSGSDDVLYLPFIDFDCLEANYNEYNCTSYSTTEYESKKIDGSNETLVSFSSEQYKRFYDSAACRRLVVNTKSKSPRDDQLGLCFYNGTSCRYSICNDNIIYVFNER